MKTNKRIKLIQEEKLDLKQRKTTDEEKQQSEEDRDLKRKTQPQRKTVHIK